MFFLCDKIHTIRLQILQKYTVDGSDDVGRTCDATSKCTVPGSTSFEAYCCNDKDLCNVGAMYKPGVVMVSMGIVVTVLKFIL